ncbi:sarcosine oxidase subunit delta [Martelella mediterranea]|uniref:Sarcosine oxidase subunit delta n=1 Tax=Martelella mediterranea TaxID=293089 RepID=A0A4R3NXQ8_9HYPH|nr:sarcosine oxidase subunit delta [Martelella mediterranea]TCT44916.1 sarcosine oxidase subunit delta [Martelella mediterranea]
MLLIRCPYCNETLPEAEFAYAGEAHIERATLPSDQSDAQWESFLFIRTNVKGPHYERWRHAHGCGRFFNAVRDTVSDRFLSTYKADEPRPDLSSLTEERT